MTRAKKIREMTLVATGGGITGSKLSVGFIAAIRAGEIGAIGSL